MAYFGVTPSNVFGQGSKDSFDGDASTTAFTLSRAVLLATDIDVFVGNVRQEPNVAYTVSGTTLTFTGTPASGTGNIYAVHQTANQGTLVPPTGLALTPSTITASGNATIGGTLGVTGATTLSGGVAGGVAVTGNVTATGTVEPAGDTAAGDNAAIGYTAAEGLILTGQGSTSDITVKNDADAEVFSVATGTTIVDFVSSPTVDGAAIGIDVSTSLTIGDASAQDVKLIFDGNAQDFHIGLDDSADDLVIGLGSTLGTTTHMAFTETGVITKPLQPAFMAQPASTQTNLAVAGTGVNIDLGTERFDVGSNFASNTFTAPVTGKYALTALFYLNALDSASDYYEFTIKTSNRNFGLVVDTSVYSGDVPYAGYCLSVIADLDASDTAFIHFYQAGGTQQTDVSTGTNFMGSLLG